MAEEVVFGTSGTTGASKSVVRSEAALAADARSLVSAFPDVWAARPAVVATVRAEHMYGALWRVRAPHVAGCVVEPATVASVEEVAAACARHGRVLLVTTPSFLEKALRHPDFPSLAGCIHAIVTSGSLLRDETSLAVARALGICPLEIFGSTEAGTVAWRRRADGEEWSLVPGVAASVADDGRLIVDSPFAMSRPLAMSDAVRFVAPRRFMLLGRTDRMVKVLEGYVSLTAVERALAAHPLVERARAELVGGDVPRVGALAVLTAAGRELLAAGTCSAVASRLRHDLMESIGERAFPRRIRFVHALPVNEQGKTAASAARNILEEWCREPAVLDWRETAGCLEATLVFTPDAECFRGHFPGFPVLPGVAQLYFVRHFARAVFPDWPDAAAYRRLKFQRLVRPGQRVRLAVRRLGEGRFEFSFASEDGLASSALVEGAAT